MTGGALAAPRLDCCRTGCEAGATDRFVEVEMEAQTRAVVTARVQRSRPPT